LWRNKARLDAGELLDGEIDAGELLDGEIDVVELLAGKLTRLQRETQNALGQLACLGNVAEVAMLSLRRRGDLGRWVA